MSDLKVGDKIKMIKQVGKFNMVNEIFEITTLSEKEIHFMHKDWGFGFMSEDEFEKYFEKIELNNYEFNLKVDDKLKLVKQFENLIPSHTHECKVLAISENTVLLEDCYNRKMIPIDKSEIFKYFTKVRKFNMNKEWTEWIETKSGFSYRTNNERYTEVKKDGYKVRSSCHPCDQFSVAKGVAVCLQKIKDKYININIVQSNIDIVCSDNEIIYDFNYGKEDISGIINKLSISDKLTLTKNFIAWYNRQNFDTFITVNKR